MFLFGSVCHGFFPLLCLEGFFPWVLVPKLSAGVHMCFFLVTSVGGGQTCVVDFSVFLISTFL